jgi:spore maturation protein CgeD
MLVEAIESVLNQTYQDFELLLMEDNSPNPEVLQTVARYWHHPKVVVYKSNVSEEERPNKVRYAVQANVGLRLAKGKYITYLCDDDFYYPKRFEWMVARLEKGDCQVVYGTQRCLRMEKGEWAEIAMRPAKEVLSKASLVVDHSSVMHTLKAGREVGGWVEHPRYWHMADAIFWDRLTEAGHLFHPIPEVCDAHRFHEGSVNEMVRLQASVAESSGV